MTSNDFFLFYIFKLLWYGPNAVVLKYIMVLFCFALDDLSDSTLI